MSAGARDVTTEPDGYPWLDLDAAEQKITLYTEVADTWETAWCAMLDQADVFERRMRDARFRAGELRLIVDQEKARRGINYEGPDPSVECAYGPCTNRLRRTEFADGPQWCSKAHREASNA